MTITSPLELDVCLSVIRGVQRVARKRSISLCSTNQEQICNNAITLKIQPHAPKCVATLPCEMARNHLAVFVTKSLYARSYRITSLNVLSHRIRRRAGPHPVWQNLKHITVGPCWKIASSDARVGYFNWILNSCLIILYACCCMCTDMGL